MTKCLKMRVVLFISNCYSVFEIITWLCHVGISGTVQAGGQVRVMGETRRPLLNVNALSLSLSLVLPQIKTVQNSERKTA